MLDRIRSGQTWRSVAALAIMVGPLIAQAATYTVTSLADSGAGSLRQAIADANANPGADTIVLSVTGAITLTSGVLAITDSLTIQGPGAGRLAVDGNGISRVFLTSGAGTDLTSAS